MAKVWSLILTEPVVFRFYVVARYKASHGYVAFVASHFLKVDSAVFK